MLERYGRLPHTVVACVGGGSNAMGIFTAFLDDPECGWWGRGRGRGHRERAAQRHPQRRHARRAARQPELPAAGRGRPGRAGALGLRRARLPRRGAGAQLAARHRPGRATSRPPTPRRSTPSRRSAGSRASSPRWRPPTRSPGCGGRPGAGRPDAPVLVCLSGRGDKDVAHVAALLGSRRVTRGPAADRASSPRPRSRS